MVQHPHEFPIFDAPLTSKRATEAASDRLRRADPDHWAFDPAAYRRGQIMSAKDARMWLGVVLYVAGCAAVLGLAVAMGWLA